MRRKTGKCEHISNWIRRNIRKMDDENFIFYGKYVQMYTKTVKNEVKYNLR